MYRNTIDECQYLSLYLLQTQSESVKPQSKKKYTFQILYGIINSLSRRGGSKERHRRRGSHQIIVLDLGTVFTSLSLYIKVPQSYVVIYIDRKTLFFFPPPPPLDQIVSRVGTDLTPFPGYRVREKVLMYNCMYVQPLDDIYINEIQVSSKI